MSAIEILFGRALAVALGWTLLHSIWQIALVAALAGAVLAALRRSAPDIRYLVSTTGLSLMLALPAATLWTTWQAAAVGTSSVASTSPKGLAGASRAIEPLATTASREESAVRPVASVASAGSVERWLPVLVALWLVGVAGLSVRLIGGWMAVRRLRLHERHPVAAGVTRAIDRLRRRLHVPTPVGAFQSAAIDVPTLIGWLKPMLLLPASALAGLSPAQLEAILAHELAHVRRHDYLVNLLQSVVETLLFFHPAVWWLSRRVRIEREHCCDDLAVSLCGDPVGYVRALAELEGGRRRQRSLVVAATDGSLLARVRRLLGETAPHDDRSSSWLAATGAVALVILAAVGASALERRSAGQTPAPVAVRAATPAAGASTPAPAPFGPQRRTGVTRTATAPRAVVAGAEPAALAEDAARLEGERAQLALERDLAASEASTAAAVSADQESSEDQAGESRIVNSDGLKRFEVRYRGRVELTDDDRDVKSISPDGYLIVSDGKWFWFKDYRLEIRPGSGGRLERRFWVDGREQPYEPAGREWFEKTLLRLVRTSGFAADSRITRLLETAGPAGVLDEISRLETDYARRIYFEKLLASRSLDAPTLSRALAQAGRELTSDYELSRVLRRVGQTQKIDRDDLRTAYFDAATHISSDYELQRTLAALLDRGPFDDALVARLLDAAGHLDSDYEASRLLRKVVETYPLTGDSRAAFFRALDTISSDYEHQRVLAAVVARDDVDPAAVAMVLQSARSIGSDYECARLLTAVSAKHSVDGPLRDDFFKAASGISSDYERQRALASVAQKPGLGEDTLVALLQTAAGLGSDYELSRLLVLVAQNNRLEGRTRDAFLDAADHIRSPHESGRVMTALVRSERGR